MNNLNDIQVLHKDDDLLVVCKPAGLPTTSPAGGDCLTRRVELLDPRAPRLHPSSRLDAHVTGIVIFARSRRATTGLLAARRKGQYQRLYQGLCERAPEPPEGRFEGAVGIDPRDHRLRRVVASDHPGAKRAATRYRLAAQATDVVLMHLWPETGRTHQLRVHLAEAGCPLLGDLVYGGRQRLVRPDGRVQRIGHVMLHCACVEVPSFAGGAAYRFIAPPPLDMVALWEAADGDSGALEVGHT